METPTTRVRRKVRQTARAVEASVDIDGAVKVSVTDVVGVAVWYAQTSKHYAFMYLCYPQVYMAMHGCQCIPVGNKNVSFV